MEKFHPPKNRLPHKEELRACFPYLKKQIEIISPKYIILLGGIAFKTLCDFGQDFSCSMYSLKLMHGKIFKGHSGILYMPTYHPASLLYNSELKDILEKDFNVIENMLYKKI